MRKVNNTQYFKVQKDTETIVSDVIDKVYVALTEKGYNPVNQIVGYVMSGDPTYITSHIHFINYIRYNCLCILLHLKILCVVNLSH